MQIQNPAQLYLLHLTFCFPKKTFVAWKGKQVGLTHLHTYTQDTNMVKKKRLVIYLITREMWILLLPIKRLLKAVITMKHYSRLNSPFSVKNHRICSDWGRHCWFSTKTVCHIINLNSIFNEGRHSAPPVPGEISAFFKQNNFSFKMKQEILGFAMFEIMQINAFL